MGAINNPAGRLHTLLTELRDQANKDKTDHETWSKVLGVHPVQVPVALADVAALLPEIDRSIAVAGASEQRELFNSFSRQWVAPIIGESPRAKPSKGPNLVDPGALAALGGLSSYLSLLAPDGAVPTDERAQELRQEVEELVRDLAADQSMPPPLATAINHRLHDILWAMDHIRVAGPGAVEEATERLLGQVVTHTNSAPEARETGMFKRVMKTMGMVWIAYKAGPEAHAALEGWQDIFQALPPGQ